MPKAARLGDIASGHGCFPNSPIIEGSGDVLINGLPAARVGDALAAHGCGKCSPHGRKVAAGSASVNINGKPAARVGDGVDCGGAVIAGSGNVFIGDLSWGGGESVPVKPKLRLRLVQSPGEVDRPYTNEPYTLYKDGGVVQKGVTDDEGMIEYEYELPWNSTLTVETLFGKYHYEPKAFVPVEEEMGVAQRLNALGFFDSDGQEQPIESEGKPGIEGFEGMVGAEPQGQHDGELVKIVKPLAP